MMVDLTAVTIPPAKAIIVTVRNDEVMNKENGDTARTIRQLLDKSGLAHVELIFLCGCDVHVIH